MSETILKNFKTSLSRLEEKNKTSIFDKVIKYIRDPSEIFQRLIWEFEKYNKEINWNERVEKMGNSAVFGNKISEKEQKKITKIHQKILYKVLKNKLKKNSRVLDFGCGYGRFSDFFVKSFNCNYVGVENTKLFLKNLKSEKRKKFLSFAYFKKNMESINDFI